MGQWAIRVKDLRKEYPGRSGPVHAVNGIDLEINHGECFGLLGPNGAGKTTTVEILEGLKRAHVRRGRSPGPGVALERRRRSASGSASRSRKPGSPTRRRCARSSSLFRSFYKSGANPDDVIAARLAREQGQLLHRAALRRPAAAAGRGGRPGRRSRGLFLDEPTTGLDPQSRRQLWDVIRDFRDRGRTIVLTTHYMDEAERLCDRVAIIDQGKIIAQGSPTELIARLGGDHIVEFALEGTGNGPAPPAESLLGLDSVLSARCENDGYSLTVAHPHRAIPALLDELERQERPLARLTTRHVSLEDVFVSLTGRHLRDDETDERGRAGPRGVRGRAKR